MRRMWRYAYPGSDDAKANISWALVKRVLGYASPYRTAIIITLILILVQTGLEMLTPLIFRDLIDNALPSEANPSGNIARLNIL